MSTRQLQIRAYNEWQGSSDIKCRYHTFDYYWFERYVRVYGLPARISGTGRRDH
jgi:hypothetical protein